MRNTRRAVDEILARNPVTATSDRKVVVLDSNFKSQSLKNFIAELGYEVIALDEMDIGSRTPLERLAVAEEKQAIFLTYDALHFSTMDPSLRCAIVVVPCKHGKNNPAAVELVLHTALGHFFEQNQVKDGRHRGGHWLYTAVSRKAADGRFVEKCCLIKKQKQPDGTITASEPVIVPVRFANHPTLKFIRNSPTAAGPRSGVIRIGLVY